MSKNKEWIEEEHSGMALRKSTEEINWTDHQKTTYVGLGTTKVNLITVARKHVFPCIKA